MHLYLMTLNLQFIKLSDLQQFFQTGILFESKDGLVTTIYQTERWRILAEEEWWVPGKLDTSMKDESKLPFRFQAYSAFQIAMISSV